VPLAKVSISSFPVPPSSDLRLVEGGMLRCNPHVWPTFPQAAPTGDDNSKLTHSDRQLAAIQSYVEREFVLGRISSMQNINMHAAPRLTPMFDTDTRLGVAVFAATSVQCPFPAPSQRALAIKLLGYTAGDDMYGK